MLRMQKNQLIKQTKETISTVGRLEKWDISGRQRALRRKLAT